VLRPLRSPSLGCVVPPPLSPCRPALRPIRRSPPALALARSRHFALPPNQDVPAIGSQPVRSRYGDPPLPRSLKDMPLESQQARPPSLASPASLASRLASDSESAWSAASTCEPLSPWSSAGISPEQSPKERLRGRSLARRTRWDTSASQLEIVDSPAASDCFAHAAPFPDRDAASACADEGSPATTPLNEHMEASLHRDVMESHPDAQALRSCPVFVLTEMFADGSADSMLRCAAVEALGSRIASGIPGFDVSPIARVISDTMEDSRVRQAALEMLGGLGSGAAFAGPALTRILADEHETFSMRKAAAVAFGKLQTHEARMVSHPSDQAEQPGPHASTPRFRRRPEWSLPAGQGASAVVMLKSSSKYRARSVCSTADTEGLGECSTARSIGDASDLSW